MKIIGINYEHFRRQHDGMYIELTNNCRLLGSHSIETNDLIDALAYGLFGEYLISRHHHQFGTRKNGYYRVQVYVCDGKNSYVFFRSAPARGNPLKLSCPPFRASKTDANNQTTTYIGKEAEDLRRSVVGVCKETVLGSFLIQGTDNDLLLSGPTNKASAFLRAFGTSQWCADSDSLKEALSTVVAKREYLKEQIKEQCSRARRLGEEYLPGFPMELMDLNALVFNNARAMQPIYDYFSAQFIQAQTLREQIRGIRLKRLEEMNHHAYHYQKYLASSTNRDLLKIGTYSRRVMVYTRYLTLAEEIDHVNRQTEELQKMMDITSAFVQQIDTLLERAQERRKRILATPMNPREIEMTEKGFSTALMWQGLPSSQDDISLAKTIYLLTMTDGEVFRNCSVYPEEQLTRSTDYMNELLEGGGHSLLVPERIQESPDAILNFRPFDFGINLVENAFLKDLDQKGKIDFQKTEIQFNNGLEETIRLLNQASEEFKDKINLLSKEKEAVSERMAQLLKRKKEFRIQGLSSQEATVRLAGARKKLTEICNLIDKEKPRCEENPAVGKQILRPSVEGLEETFQNILSQADSLVEQAQDNLSRYGEYMDSIRDIYNRIQSLQKLYDVINTNYFSLVQTIYDLTGDRQFGRVLHRKMSENKESEHVYRQSKEMLKRAQIIFNNINGSQCALRLEKATDGRNALAYLDVLVSEKAVGRLDDDGEEEWMTIDALSAKEKQIMSFALNYAINSYLIETTGKPLTSLIIIDELHEEITKEQRKKMEKYIEEMPEVHYIYLAPNYEGSYSLARAKFSLS